jgi:hypothetical protein
MEATTSGGRSAGVEVSFSSSQKTSVSGGGSAILPSGSGANIIFSQLSQLSAAIFCCQLPGGNMGPEYV